MAVPQSSVLGPLIFITKNLSNYLKSWIYHIIFGWYLSSDVCEHTRGISLFGSDISLSGGKVRLWVLIHKKKQNCYALEIRSSPFSLNIANITIESTNLSKFLDVGLVSVGGYHKVLCWARLFFLCYINNRYKYLKS